jgi:putative tryptophan/tyrosine transport system substrate-binding protein
MDRRTVVGAVAGYLLAAPLAGLAQQFGKMYRIAHLSGSGQVASKAFINAFREGMAAIGYREGENIVLDERYAEGDVQRLPSLALELINSKPDVLLVSTTPGNLAAKAATSTIPIVMVLVADPVGAGVVTSLAKPGGNITGITNIVAELAGKRLEIVKEIIPGLSRVAVLVNPDSQNAPLQMRSAEDTARALGIELGPVIAVRSADDLEKAFESAARAHSRAAIRMIDPLVFMLRKETAALATKYRLPMIYPSSEDVEAGGLVAYGTNVPEQYRLAATFVNKILHGARPSDIPVEQPTKFDLVINMKTAKALGLTIPQSLLLRADKLIK